MAGAVLCHPPGPHPACRTTDTRSSGHLDRSARRVCGASSARPPRRGSDVAGFSTSERSDHNVPHYAPGFAINKYLCPTGRAKPEVLRLLAPQRGLTAIAKSKPKTEQTTNGRLPELSNFGSPPAEPGVYHD